MNLINTAAGIKSRIESLGLRPVGFVPTMGALHEGHISLVKSALLKCPLLVVSIYVNPTQFNDKEDLRNYPRNLEADLALLGKYMREDDIVFAPVDSEIYPEEDKRIFSFGNLDRVMEAVHRPGHFNGVAQVVSRLFGIVRPDIAIFGQKDFQQLAVIRELVRQTGKPVSIIGSPIVREKDGLAMSSRNVLLEPQIRRDAPVIYNTLRTAAAMITDHEIADIRSFVFENINRVPGFTVEYFEIADDRELIPVSSKEEMKGPVKYFGCIAVQAGKVRLIDNIEIGLV